MSHRGGFRTVEDLILASASPRRRRFLTDLGLYFKAMAANITEEAAPFEEAADFVKRISREKAGALALHYPETWILAADTVVVLDGEILGKPEDADHAQRMLKRLSDRWHEVWTGFCICRKRAAIAVEQAVRTEVRFISLTEELRHAYVMTGESLDKAGGYGIQGKGGFLVEQIRGSYSNVVGLPLAEVIRSLLDLGVIAPVVEEYPGAG